VRHFFPDLNDWLQRLPDTRDPDACIYPTRFLAWWGLALYRLQLGSRRQLDFKLHPRGTPVLDNLNRLAGTNQLQIAFILLQLLEQGSLLRRLVAEWQRPPWQLLGGLMNVAWLLRESLRRDEWAAAWFATAAKERIRFQPVNTS
jgi:hypothetical protein